uniref:Uncharacterized protein n=1 Tax=Parascaris equorum TaxID=6256 RepID=A0A914S0G8_PAREQ
MLEHYRDDQRLFGLLRYASIMRSKHLNPFGRSVLGVFTREPYTIRNFTLLLLQYQKFIAAYFATVTLISFAICYRYGPPTDVRSHNLAQWALQSIALAFIYFSCQIVEVAYSVMAVLLFWAAAKGWIVPVVMKFFAVMNTVSSPEVNAWKITSSLSDPKRLGTFSM